MYVKSKRRLACCIPKTYIWVNHITTFRHPKYEYLYVNLPTTVHPPKPKVLQGNVVCTRTGESKKEMEPQFCTIPIYKITSLNTEFIYMKFPLFTTSTQIYSKNNNHHRHNNNTKYQQPREATEAAGWWESNTAGAMSFFSPLRRFLTVLYLSILTFCLGETH